MGLIDLGIDKWLQEDEGAKLPSRGILFAISR